MSMWGFYYVIFYLYFYVRNNKVEIIKGIWLVFLLGFVVMEFKFVVRWGKRIVMYLKV